MVNITLLMKHYAAIAAVALATSAVANDGHATQTGSAINYSKSKTVQMVSEDIDIDFGKDSAKISVDFVFKNHGPAQTVTMAFPDRGYSIQTPTIEGIKSWVDGKAVKMAYRDLTKEGEAEWLSHGVWVKDVAFAKGSTKRVKVSYTVPHGGSIMLDKGCTYILKTGATWYGPIERTTIDVDWKSAGLSHPPAFLENRSTEAEQRLSASDRWRINGTHGTATYRNFTPDFDVTLHATQGFWNFTLNGGYVPYRHSQFRTLGTPDDLLVPVSELGNLFSASDHDKWAHPVTRRFGGAITFPGGKEMLLGGRRKVMLARPVSFKKGANIWKDDEAVAMVRLKDVVGGLGGSYTYDRTRDRVVIRIPR